MSRFYGSLCITTPIHSIVYWETVSKTVRPMLLVHCLSVLSVCDVGVLWPNGWMDQDETWRAGRPRPWPHCVRWGPCTAPQLSAHICYGQMASWIKMPLGMELGLGPGDFVLDADPAPLPRKGAKPPNFRPMFIVSKRLDRSRWYLTWR